MTLSDDELEARIAALGIEGHPLAALDEPYQYRFIRPFSEAADDYVELLLNEDGRWLFGIPEVDVKVRGVRPGELMYVAGRPHSGKTQLVLQSIVNNPDRPVLFFTFDEVDSLVLAKIVSMTRHISNDELEHAIKTRNRDYIDIIRKAATVDFSKLVVVDQPLNFRNMADALKEAEDFWQEEAACIVIDYLDLIPGGMNDAEGTKAKADRLKGWTKSSDRPVIVLHQSKRGGAARGQAAGMEGMRFGGEDGATFVVEVFRKRDDESLDAFVRDQHRNTITVNVDKNKRPPCKRGMDDLYIDPRFGYIRPLQDGDMAVRGAPIKGPAAALAAQRAMEDDPS